eukprot:7291487-Pyramimonas_sp.AAC.1
MELRLEPERQLPELLQGKPRAAMPIVVPIPQPRDHVLRRPLVEDRDALEPSLQRPRHQLVLWLLQLGVVLPGAVKSEVASAGERPI